MTENAPAPQPVPGPGEEGYRQDPALRPGEETYEQNIAKAKAMGQAELAVHDDIVSLDKIADRAWGILNNMDEDMAANVGKNSLGEQLKSTEKRNRHRDRTHQVDDIADHFRRIRPGVVERAGRKYDREHPSS